MKSFPSRPDRILCRSVVLLALLALAMSSTVWSQSPANRDLFIGTGRSRVSKGIYHCQLDLRSGRLTPTRLVAEISGPGFLAWHPKLPCLYAVGALNQEACVAAYRVDGAGPKTRLELLNSVPIEDGGGTHLTVDPTGRTLITVQYGGGSVAVFALKPDGSIRERTQLIEHEGGSRVVPRRQESPHPHYVGLSPDARFAFVPDLGLDQVVIYRVDAERAALTPHGTASVPPGAGPRHMKFHTTGRWAYVLNELDLSVSVFDYDAESGRLSRKQTMPTVPKEQLAKEPFKSCSEIRVHPSGKYVYAANRGHDTITAFRVHPETGTLLVIEREFIRGATPRNFNLDPSGKWLVAAGQASNTLASFAVDGTTGEMAYTGSNVFSPTPICVLFGRE